MPESQIPQYIKLVSLLVLTAGGAGLAAYHQANPTITWAAVAIAVVSSLVLGLSTPPAAVKTMAAQHEHIERLMSMLDADRSRK